MLLHTQGKLYSDRNGGSPRRLWHVRVGRNHRLNILHVRVGPSPSANARWWTSTARLSRACTAATNPQAVSACTDLQGAPCKAESLEKTQLRSSPRDESLRDLGLTPAPARKITEALHGPTTCKPYMGQSRALSNSRHAWRFWKGGLAPAEDTTFYPKVNECPARQRIFNTAGLLAKYHRYTNQNPIFVATHTC